ncbi:hypothetical protein E2C01_088275 [Portunus trituberculatus]|uniref:Uncharacterized protein n=1 Tax=Portunus trituberculatus TaxID=210409 RepID=A0A5B7JFI7_PORTR|nr:hypothetical protein [Portunus trituberculatus]
MACRVSLQQDTAVDRWLRRNGAQQDQEGDVLIGYQRATSFMGEEKSLHGKHLFAVNKLWGRPRYFSK